MLKNFVILIFALNVAPAFADIEWSGLYRIEGYNISNSEMRDNQKKHLAYALSHLILAPKITAGDGLTIYGRFDIMNSSKYPNSQMGQIWGDGVGGSSTQDPGGIDDPSQSNTTANSMASETLQISELYLTYTHEFGQLIVGRAPLQFGLGITYNAGHGLFDHWYDTRDMIGYKVILGNFWFLPMIAKASGGDINHSNDINDYLIQAEYENPETDLQMGVFFSWRHGGPQAADAPVGQGPTGSPGQVLGGNGATNNYGSYNNTGSAFAYTKCTNPGNCSTGIDEKTVNVYVLKDSPRVRAGMEASFSSGSTGVIDSSSNPVTLGGFAVATEFEYRPENSNWKWGLKGGYASGDDPGTPDKFEGYQMNRNYDVAMLLFNHPLGQADMLRSGLITGNVYDKASIGANGAGDINRADVEAISNVIYLAPRGTYSMSEHWSMENTLVTGWLATNAVQNQPGKSLGFEYDLSFSFTPRKGVQWINQMGLLFPGQAWQGDGTLTNSFAYGFGTKAAISF